MRDAAKLALTDIGLGVFIAIFIFVVINLSGCASPRDYHQMTDQVAEYGVSKIVDKKTGKVLYFYRDADNFQMVVTDQK